MLKLASKGRLQKGADADVLVIDITDLQPKHVLALGKRLLGEA